MNEQSFDKVAPIVDEGVKLCPSEKKADAKGNAAKIGAFIYSKGKAAGDFMAEQGKKISVLMM